MYYFHNQNKRTHAHGLLSLLVLLLCCSLLLAGCSGKDPKPSPTDPNVVTTAEPIVTDTPAEQPLLLTKGSEAIYRIIRPSNTTDAVIDAIIELRNEIKRLGGVSLQIYEDFDYLTEDHTDRHELIIGYTLAPNSLELMKGLGYGDSCIKVDGNKTYIAAHSEESLLSAIETMRTELIQAYTTESGESAVRLIGGKEIKQPAPTGWLESAGIQFSDCSIVYPKSSTELKTAANKLALAIRQSFSVSLTVRDDSTPVQANEIQIGKPANRPTASQNTPPSALYICFRILQGNLCVAGADDKSTAQAIDQLIRQLRNAKLFSNRFDLPQDMNTVLLRYSGSPKPLSDGANTRIMSFNILANAWGGGSLTNRDISAVATILAHQPDVCGLQEVDTDWYGALADMLEPEGYKFVVKDTAGNGSGAPLYTTLIYNSKTVRLIESGIQPYSTNNDDIRTMIWGLFERIDTGTRFIGLSTHWDLPEQTAKRTIHSAEMASYVKQLSQTHQVPVFCTGDFNTVQSDQQYIDFLANSGFSDAAYTATEKGLVCRTIHAIGKLPTTSNPESYDHIFHSPDITPHYYSVIIDQTALDTSDHAPLIADFTV